MIGEKPMIFEKTRELAEAIMNTSAYKHMKDAETAVELSDTASKKLEDFNRLRQAFNHLMKDHFDRQQADDLREQLRLANESLLHDTDILNMQQAQKAFQDLMNQINQHLRFYITGETATGCANESCHGCASSCAGEHK